MARIAEYNIITFTTVGSKFEQIIRSSLISLSYLVFGKWVK
jgi:hypothetical protein